MECNEIQSKKTFQNDQLQNISAQSIKKTLAIDGFIKNPASKVIFINFLVPIYLWTSFFMKMSLLFCPFLADTTVTHARCQLPRYTFIKPRGKKWSSTREGKWMSLYRKYVIVNNNHLTSILLQLTQWMLVRWDSVTSTLFRLVPCQISRLYFDAGNDRKMTYVLLRGHYMLKFTYVLIPNKTLARQTKIHNR